METRGVYHGLVEAQNLRVKGEDEDALDEDGMEGKTNISTKCSMNEFSLHSNSLLRSN